MSRPSQKSASAQPIGDWLSPGRFSLILATLIFAWFPQVLLGAQTFVVRDFGFFAYPLAHYQRECFWRGELPLWNPLNNCGVPFLAQWNTMPLYPPALIYLTLPLTWSLSFFCLLHFFWAGLGMYFLGHRWTANRFAAAIAGVVFAFNGLSLNMLMWPSHIATLSWTPWVVLGVQRGWQEGGRKLVLAVLAGALQMLAGGPETIMLTWLLLLVLWAVECIGEARLCEAQHVGSSESGGARPSPGAATCDATGLSDPLKRAAPEAYGPSVPAPARLQLMLRFGLMVLLVAGAAAAQLLPFLDLAAHSQREQGYADTRWSLPLWGWANFLVPMVFGQVWSMGVFFQHEQSWTSSYYLGIGTVLLILLAVCKARGRLIWVLIATAGAALLLALGEKCFAYRWLRHIFPQLSLMTYPVKFVTLVVIVAPLLAGFGLATFQNAPEDERKRVEKRIVALSAVLLGLVSAILFWAGKSAFPGDDFSLTLHNGITRAVFLVAASVVLLILLRTRAAAEAPLRNTPQRADMKVDAPAGESPSAAERGLSAALGRVAPLLMLLLFWLDVFTHEPNQNPTVDPSVYAAGLAREKLAMNPQPVWGQSRAMVSPAAEIKFTRFIMSDPKNNLLVKRLGYFADCNLLDGVPKINGFFSLYPHECGELNSVLYGSTNADFQRLEDFMSVSQITAPGEFFKWRPRETFLPLVTAGQRPVFLDDTNALLGALRPDFDPSQVAFLPPATRQFVTATNQTQAHVLSPLRFSSQRIEADIEAGEPSLVVVSQSYYHSWRAYVDGHSTPLLRANYAFQAVAVPTGRHQLRLAYEDRAFHVGLLISGFSVAFCLAWWCLTPKPRALSL